MGGNYSQIEDEGPHYSEFEFQNRIELSKGQRNCLLCMSIAFCCPCIYCCVVYSLPYYRGIPLNSRPLVDGQAEDYSRRMDGSFSFATLSATMHGGKPIPYTYEKVEIYGRKMIYSGGFHAVSHHNHHHGHTHHGAQPNQPQEMHLNFFEKDQSSVFIDNYGSIMDLRETDFVTQIVIDHFLGFRIRLTRMGQVQAVLIQPAAPVMQAPYQQQAYPPQPVGVAYPPQQLQQPQQPVGVPYPPQPSYPPTQSDPYSPQQPLLTSPPPSEAPTAPPVSCVKCTNPKPFPDAVFCGKCGTEFPA